MKKSQKGFTLIELLVVIAIIGLLSTLAVVALNSARQRSRDAKRVADIRQIQTALELGFSEGSIYPTAGPTTNLVLGSADATQLCINDAATAVPIFANAAGNVAGTAPAAGGANGTSCAGTTFMGLVPSNPSPGGADYLYDSTDGGTYNIDFTLEGATGQLPAAENCATPDGITGGAC